jgi:uncharacterized protein YmfQ (DUF2313 family)
MVMIALDQVACDTHTNRIIKSAKMVLQKQNPCGSHSIDFWDFLAAFFGIFLWFYLLF